MRVREHPIVDIHLSTSKITRLSKGYTVHKKVKGLRYCLSNGRDRSTVRQIDKLKTEIKRLKGLK